MTRKDYVKFAEAIRETRKVGVEHAIRFNTLFAAPEALGLLETKLADIFAADSKLFDRERFYKACEPKEGE